ncbi:NAD(P)-dependent oxidoreductase [Mycobacterium sp.]|uniref:NAD(P)-dependent oxidoreductase n=1 Tax=Mycobacterium sp. TaxID=1785 RepID=UPI003BAA12BC
MKVTLFGATGQLGRECLTQCLEANHDVTVLVRTPGKLADVASEKVIVVQGDALSPSDVLRALPRGTQAVLFAIGVDEKTSPPDLCTDATRNILAAMRRNDVPRFVWCGGGSTIVTDDTVTLGSRFVRFFAERFLKLRHIDKEHQWALLEENRDIRWIGIRPLQMKVGPQTGKYRLGFDAFSAMSKISFADCAHAMVEMLDSDTWVGKAPIIQY